MQKQISTLRIALAQLNVCVADVQGNLNKIKQAINEAKAQQADIILLPELALSGYSPEDL